MIFHRQQFGFEPLNNNLQQLPIRTTTYKTNVLKQHHQCLKTTPKKANYSNNNNNCDNGNKDYDDQRDGDDDNGNINLVL